MSKWPPGKWQGERGVGEYYSLDLTSGGHQNGRLSARKSMTNPETDAEDIQTDEHGALREQDVDADAELVMNAGFDSVAEGKDKNGDLEELDNGRNGQ
ncbi:uncharacterized protein DSM5745_09892 [Aspergillus mulundensis]|uniref:Uncharacterized protein n=1 Tax=Aspergillus mulundensis TaxID=1810919 RepID=A0A3D8QS21_9EURO|nr:hypothetical protein DSM5745_09892 [Aspergillus mulundensis]RDW64481.1 hypothetical protein DSM5745_09892 [Aspergillus mulundensis]